MTDVTKVVISATDEASQVFQRVQTSAERLQAAYSKLAESFQALGVGLSAAGLVAFANSTIDAIAKMKDLGEKAGITAEAMSKFEAPTRIAGSTLDVTAAAMARLSRAAIEAQDPATKSALALAAIGISAKQIKDLSPDQLFEKIARALDNYGDSLQKNAVMQQLLGRGAAELSSTMKQIAATSELHASVTQEDADAAKKFQEQVVELNMAGEKFWRSIASDWIPKLTDAAKKLTEAKEGAGYLKTALIGLFGIFGIDLSSMALSPIDKLKQKIQELQDAVNHAPSKGVLGENFDAYIKRYTDEIAKLQKQLSQLQHAAPTLYGEGDTGLPDTVPLLKPAPKFNPEDMKAQAFYTQALKEATAELTTAQAAEAAGATPLTEAQKKLLQLEADPNWKLLSKQSQTNIEVLSDQANMHQAVAQRINAQAEAQKALNDIDEQTQKEIAAILDKGGDRLKSLDVEIDAYKRETDILGQNSTAQELLQLELKKEADLRGVVNDATRAAITAKYDELAALIAQRAEIEQQMAIWNQLGDTVGKFFGDLITEGHKAFDDLRQTLKQFAADVIAFFAKRYVLQMVAGAAGGTGTTAMAANAAGSQMGSSTLGLALSGANEGLGSLFYGGGTTLTAGLSTTLFGSAGLTDSLAFTGTGLSGAAGTAAMAAGASAETAAAIASWVPVIGWVIAIAAILYAAFGNKGGGPKTQGAFAGLFSGSGDLLSSLPGAEDIVNIHGTQDESNTSASQIGRAAGRGISSSVQALGGNPSAYELGVGFSMDAGGTAPSFFHGTLADPSGNVYFRYNNDNMSRDSSTFQTQVQASLQRMIVAALQHDNTLDPAIQRYVKTIDASTASDDDVQRILKGAAAIKTLMGEMKDIQATIDDLDSNGMTGLKSAIDSMNQSVSDASDAFNAAFTKGDPQEFLQAEQNYKQAVLQRYAQEVQMVRQLQQNIRSVEESAYQFSVAMAQKINAVGGSIDVGAIALGRASTLRSQIGGNEPLEFKIQDIQSYVGAIDTWYQTRHDAIMAGAEAEAKAANAAYQAQAAAAQARAQQLQTELQTVQQLQAIADRAGAMLKELQLSGSNPLAAPGRLAMAKDSVDQLKAAYAAATGTDKATIGQQLLDALQAERGLLDTTFQRPSNDFLTFYNQIARDLAGVQADSQTLQQKSVDLQQQIADAQDEANRYAAMTADAATIAAPAIQALNDEARGYYTWAQDNGTTLLEQQRTAYLAQLNAITGGSDPEIFLAGEATKMRTLLESIDTKIGAFLQAVGGGSTGSTTTPPGAAGTSPYAGAPTGVTIVLPATGPTPKAIIAAVKAAMPELKRLQKVS